MQRKAGISEHRSWSCRLTALVVAVTWAACALLSATARADDAAAALTQVTVLRDIE
jgi:hypothetical protein